MQYWCKFDVEGHVIGTSTEAREGYVETSLEDLQKYLEPHGIDTGGYVRDAQTGKPVVAPPTYKITPQTIQEEPINNSRVNVAETLALMNARLAALEVKEEHHD